MNAIKKRAVDIIAAISFPLKVQIQATVKIILYI